MVDTTSLARRARKSEDGEAYEPIAKEGGYRLGLGARTASRPEPDFFVEIVLDPFPERPAVDPSQLGDEAELLERLRARGYRLSCDDAGVVTCERTLDRSASRKEAAEVSALLHAQRSRNAGGRRT